MDTLPHSYCFKTPIPWCSNIKNHTFVPSYKSLVCVLSVCSDTWTAPWEWSSIEYQRIIHQCRAAAGVLRCWPRSPAGSSLIPGSGLTPSHPDCCQLTGYLYLCCTLCLPKQRPGSLIAICRAEYRDPPRDSPNITSCIVLYCFKILENNLTTSQETRFAKFLDGWLVFLIV